MKEDTIMKRVKVYVCEKCSKKYPFKSEAARCEEGHVKDECKHKKLHYYFETSEEDELSVYECCASCSKTLNGRTLWSSEDQKQIKDIYNLLTINLNMA